MFSFVWKAITNRLDTVTVCAGQSADGKFLGIVGSAKKTEQFGTESLLVFQGHFTAIWWYWQMVFWAWSGYTVHSVRGKKGSEENEQISGENAAGWF